LFTHAQTVPPPVLVSGGATATSSSLELASRPASNAIDGDFAGRRTWGSCTATKANAGEWLRIEMTENFAVRTIFHVTDTSRRLQNFYYSVGDDPDVTKNPKCSDSAYTNGGLYECDLNGLYFGIFKPDSNRVHVCELRLFSRKTASPYFTVKGTGRSM